MEQTQGYGRGRGRRVPPKAQRTYRRMHEGLVAMIAQDQILDEDESSVELVDDDEQPSIDYKINQ